jgi:hypothetical protein
MREERVTFFVRGDAALRLDAVAFAIFERDGQSTSRRPSRSAELRELSLYPERWSTVVVRLHRCERCARVFGAPWCWEHDNQHVTPCEESS